MEAYEPIAAYYDSEHDSFADDIEWYLHLARVAGPRVLELSCGSGRLLAPLAAAGNRVVGVDSSEAMLERARERLHSTIARGQVTLVQGDMQDLAAFGPGSFDLVIIPLNGLLHVEFVREVPEAMKPRTIPITNPSKLLEATAAQTAA